MACFMSAPEGPASTVARSLFGFTLRPSQEQAVQAVVEGWDTLAVLPTGSGKSAIYQVAGLIIGGLTLVVSPLIALQRDQLRSITGRQYASRPVKAALLNSAQPVRDRRLTLDLLAKGELDFLFVGPEQLANAETAAAVRTGARAVGLFCVDEAHLVSEWGQEFRPEYLRLTDVVTSLGSPPVLALTATASPPVQSDITRRLGMRTPQVVVGDFDRPNISLSMRYTEPASTEPRAVDDRCVDVLMQQKTPALVYALTHARCEALAERLRRNGLRAAAYHGGLPAGTRASVQDAFFTGSLDVVVATSAFGLGVDKPDIRAVVHAGVPASIDDYYQEIGRAGRDGQPASAILVHDARTIRIPRSLAARTHLGESTLHRIVDALENTGCDIAVADLARAANVSAHSTDRVVNELADMGIVQVHGSGHHRTLKPRSRSPHSAALIGQLLKRDERRQVIVASRLDAARHYAETTRCRRAELLAYFGETYTAPCGNCDNDRMQERMPTRRPVVLDGGTPVLHRLWGEGHLLSRDEHELLVYFSSVGYKHLTPSTLASGILQQV
jgi:ATP-dependent DNA helicase RecQ